MKLGAVVSAVNLNPHYMSFVPQFLRGWTTLFPDVEIIIVVIADEMPEEFLPYAKYLRLFSIPKDISSVLTSQCIRLLWPRFVDTRDAVLITDIDMIPLQRDYYTKHIRNENDNTVVVYRHGLPEELYMCYIAATPKIWTELFGSESHLDILQRWYEESNVWNKDQTELTKAFNNWSGTKRLYTDKETGFRRLCRSFLERNPNTVERQLIDDREKIKLLIRSGVFADYHALANTTYAEFNEFVIDCLKDMVDREQFVTENTYTSYLPLVFQAAATTDFPIIECGMGYGSTSLFHSLDRQVISYETNPEWFGLFDVKNKYLIGGDDWLSLMNMYKYSKVIMFLDHAPGESREQCLAVLSNGFDGIIVAHDTEPAADSGYKMRQHFPNFKYVVEVKTIGAWATAMSNEVDITKWIGLQFGEYTITAFVPPTSTEIPKNPLERTFFNTLRTRFHSIK